MNNLEQLKNKTMGDIKDLTKEFIQLPKREVTEIQDLIDNLDTKIEVRL